MKRFKYLLMALVMATCIVGSSGSASGSSYSTGKAVIPWFASNVDQMSWYSVSNITDSPIDVIITFYESEGSLLIDDNNSTTGRITGTAELLNYNDRNTDSTLTFKLNPHSTGKFYAYFTNEVEYGYGIIQWKQGGNALQGLVVNGETYTNRTGEESRGHIPVNNGLPF